MNYKLTARELSSFCGQMGMLLHSGISTAEGLHILCDESKTDADRQILTPVLWKKTVLFPRHWKRSAVSLHL